MKVNKLNFFIVAVFQNVSTWFVSNGGKSFQQSGILWYFVVKSFYF